MGTCLLACEDIPSLKVKERMVCRTKKNCLVCGLVWTFLGLPLPALMMGYLPLDILPEIGVGTYVSPGKGTQ